MAKYLMGTKESDYNHPALHLDKSTLLERLDSLSLIINNSDDNLAVCRSRCV